MTITVAVDDVMKSCRVVGNGGHQGGSIFACQALGHGEQEQSKGNRVRDRDVNKQKHRFQVDQACKNSY